MQGVGLGATPFRAEIRALFTVAMAVFVVTVVIGILNGLDLVSFDRADLFGGNTLMTHVHAGTLGWITLSVFAACLWLFGESAGAAGSWVRPLAWLSGVGIPLYVAAFYAGVAVDLNVVYPLRAITGTVVLAAMLGFLWWCWRASRGAPMTTARFAFLGGLVTVVIGAIFGVLLQVQYATKGTLFPGGVDPIGAHVTAMAFSYLVLVGMGIAEWRLMPGATFTRWAAAQVVLLFLGGLILVVASLIGMLQLAGLNLLFEVAATVIFVARLWPAIARAAWLAAGSARHFAASAIFVPIDILILAYLLVVYVIMAEPTEGGGGPDLASIPAWLIFALDHAVFIGVLTNAIFGLFGEATHGRAAFWSWADHVIFWGVNIGLIGFVAGLATETVVLKQVFSAIMGVSILVGLLTYAVRFWGGREEATSPAWGP